MLALQHLPVSSPSFFASPSQSPASASPSSSPFPMAESPSVHHRPRRSSRPLFNSGLASPPSTASSYAAFPRFQSGETSSQNTPALSMSGSRLRFGESWNDQDNYGASSYFPESLATSQLPDGRFIETFRNTPKAVATVISFLHGPHEVLSFCHVNKQMRQLVESFFDNENPVRDAFLTRSISGYQPSTSPKATWLNRALKIDLTDLELLCQYTTSAPRYLISLTIFTVESNSVSLAVYPTHALRVLTSPQSSVSSADAGENDNTTARFQTLTLTHSRFVAYLRHRTAPQALLLASQDEDDVIAPSPDSSASGLPEIVFPSPLFYFQNVEPPVTPAYLPLPSTEAKSLSRASKEKDLSHPKLSKSKSTSNFRPSTADSSENGTKGTSRIKRLSLKPKRKSGVPPPPPTSMPPGLATTPFDVSQFGSLSHSTGISMSQEVYIVQQKAAVCTLSTRTDANGRWYAVEEEAWRLRFVTLAAHQRSGSSKSLLSD